MTSDTAYAVASRERLEWGVAFTDETAAAKYPNFQFQEIVWNPLKLYFTWKLLFNQVVSYIQTLNNTP